MPVNGGDGRQGLECELSGILGHQLWKLEALVTNAERCAQMAHIAAFAPLLTDDEKFRHVMACKQKDAEAWDRIQRPPQRDLFQGE
jgi:hypothetical protein